MGEDYMETLFSNFLEVKNYFKIKTKRKPFSTWGFLQVFIFAFQIYIFSFTLVISEGLSCKKDSKPGQGAILSENRNICMASCIWKLFPIYFFKLQK